MCFDTTAAKTKKHCHLQRFLPSDLFLQLGAEQQIGEEENVPQLPGSLH